MAIQVICPGCHQRFSVSDKFAGQKGPCPKCKKEIEIPAAGDDVKVHAPEGFGPKDSQGRQVLKPIFREETKISSVQLVGIIGSIVVVLVVAMVIRMQAYPVADFPVFLLIGGAVLLGPALAYAAYTFMRDQETEPFRGQELMIRVAICGLLYAATWGVYFLIGLADVEISMTASIVGIVIMIGLGGGIAFVSFDMDYLMGTMHYGLFLIACIVLRCIVGLGPIPLDT